MSYSGVKGLHIHNKKHPEDRTKGDVHTLLWGGNFLLKDLDTQIYNKKKLCKKGYDLIVPNI